MKQLLIFSIFCSAILLVACKKNDETPQKVCKILTEVSEGDGHSSKTELIYNANGQVEKQNVYNDNQLAEYYTFTYTGTNVTTLNVYADAKTNQITNTATFSYNADNTVQEMNTFFEDLTGKHACKISYTYDAQQELITSTLNPVKSSINPKHYILEGHIDHLKYDAKGNVMQVERETINDATDVNIVVSTYTYTDKAHTVKVQGIPNAGVLYELFENFVAADYSEFSENAPATIKLIFPYANGVMNVAATVGYTYNTDNLPTNADIQVEYDYQVKGKSIQKISNKKLDTFTYDCK